MGLDYYRAIGRLGFHWDFLPYHETVLFWLSSFIVNVAGCQAECFVKWDVAPVETCLHIPIERIFIFVQSNRGKRVRLWSGQYYHCRPLFLPSTFSHICRKLYRFIFTTLPRGVPCRCFALPISIGFDANSLLFFRRSRLQQ